VRESRVGLRRLAWAAVLLTAGAAWACGKRGDPLPPLKRAPLPASAFRVTQRGDHLEISLVAPRTATDGSRLPVIEVEVLRAPEKGVFTKVAQVSTRRAAPGERLVEEERPLPAAGTVLRYAARVRANGEASALSAIATVTVGPTPPAAAGLTARSAENGVALAWELPAGTALVVASPSPSPPPAPSLEASPSPDTLSAPVPGPSPEPQPSPSPSPEPLPSAGLSPEPSPSPTPPGVAFHVYRRTALGSFDLPVSSTALAATAYDDEGAVPGQDLCYVVRTVTSAAPTIESEPSNEACLTVEDVTPPPVPAGVTARETPEGIEVDWSPASESDTKAFRVYRSIGDGPPKLVAEVPAPATTYLDTTPPADELVRYTLRAMDAAGNESAASPSAAALRP
jgi:hypothetical protein